MRLDALSNSAWRRHDPCFGSIFVRGQAARLWDDQGRDYIDLTCGYSTTNLGHAFAPLVAAAQEQLGKLTHLTGALHTGKLQLAERLLQVLGLDEDGLGDPKIDDSRKYKVLFNATGARAIESAWKAAAAFRPGKILTIAPGFHGRSIATGSLSSTVKSLPQVDPSNYVVAESKHYPYCACCPLGLSHPTCQLACAQPLFDMLESDAREISAILVEPALGARGYVFPPNEFFVELARVARRADILLIADEIQTGLGRCGDWTLSLLQGWQPDLLVLGKSLGGGICPISAVVGRADVLDAIPEGAESETFAGTPLACRVALEVLSELANKPWMAQGAQIGAELRAWFAQLCCSQVSQASRVSAAGEDRNYPAVPSIEGMGANCVIEFSSGAVSPKELEVQQISARLLAERFYEHGLLIQLTGPHLTRIVMLPPLNLCSTEMSEIKSRSAAAWQAVKARAFAV